MAHTYDISTDRGRVRLGLADTRAETAWFTDAEIDHFLTTGGSVNEAINEGLRVLLAGHAAKGDTAKVAEIERALAMRGGSMPTVQIGEGNSLPTDDAYVWP